MVNLKITFSDAEIIHAVMQNVFGLDHHDYLCALQSLVIKYRNQGLNIAEYEDSGALVYEFCYEFLKRANWVGVLANGYTNDELIEELIDRINATHPDVYDLILLYTKRLWETVIYNTDKNFYKEFPNEYADMIKVQMFLEHIR